jgi:autotransporter-associated beta strand protein
VANTINSAIVLNSDATSVAFINRGNQNQTFSNTATISGSGGGNQTLTIGGSGAAGGATTFNGIISNGSATSVSLVMNALATTNLAAANTYTGSTSIFAGTLSISNTSTFTNTSAINLYGTGRLNVGVANASLAKLSTAGGGSGVTAGSFLRYSAAQTSAGSGNGPGTIFGTVELNTTNVNPNYVLDFGEGGALTNLVTSTYTSALTLSGTATIDSSSAVATFTTGGITASTSGSKSLNLTGLNNGANTISSSIGNGSGTIGLIKGGGGNWILSGTNTYTGNTLVDGGTLQFANRVSLYNAGAATTWSKTNIVVTNGATMAFNVGGAGQFTKSDINTLLGLSDAATNGFRSGSILGLDTTAATCYLIASSPTPIAEQTYSV